MFTECKRILRHQAKESSTTSGDTQGAEGGSHPPPEAEGGVAQAHRCSSDLVGVGLIAVVSNSGNP